MSNEEPARPAARTWKSVIREIVILHGNSHFAAAGILLCSIGLIVARQPVLFLEPRLWAEEGGRYFSYAYSHSWLESLFQAHGGYFALWPNVATTLAANCVPLDRAPLVTTIASFIVQLFPLAIILWSNSPLWNAGATHFSWLKKTAAVTIIVVAPISDEVWLNTICSQFFFSLTTLLILVEGVNPGPAKRWFHRTLLAISGLTGLLSCILAPLFCVKWFTGKEKENRTRAVILLVCLVIQLIVAATFLRANPHPEGKTSRFAGIDHSLFATIAFTHTIAPIVIGLDNTLSFSSLIFSQHRNTSIFRSVGNVLLLLEGLLFVLLISSRRQRNNSFYLMGGYLLLFLFSIGFSVGDRYSFIFPTASTRYTYVPTVIVMLLLLANVQLNRKSRFSINSAACLLLLALAFGCSFSEYWHSHSYFAQVGEYRKINWRQEISTWEKDNNYPVKIWPAGWEISLSRK